MLKLNGISVLMEQKDDAINCRKIIIEPGKPAKVVGFYTEDGSGAVKMSPFKILVGDAAKAKVEELGEKAKEIAIDVFQTGDKPVEEDITVSTRGMKKPDEKSARASPSARSSSPTSPTRRSRSRTLRSWSSPTRCGWPACRSG